ncbi:hypothetical protein [Staphylococcus simulans]
MSFVEFGVEVSLAVLFVVLLSVVDGASVVPDEVSGAAASELDVSFDGVV